MIPIKHFGDITKIHGNEVPIVDIITGGSPCQDLSVAGKRAGIQHADLGDEETTRSGLFMDQIRIVKEMHNECRKSNQPIRPRYLVWENVAGAFSSGEPGGSDFQAVLEEICKVVRHECPPVPIPKDGWSNSGNLDGVGDDGTPFSICWRTHDAQYWGVPQRRRRIALVADFRGTSAPEILFECEGMSGNSQSSKQEGQGTSTDTSRCVGETSKDGRFDEQQLDESGSCLNPYQSSNATVFGISAYDSNSMRSDNPHSGIYEADSARTLDLNGGNPACNQGGMMVVQESDNSQVNGLTNNEPICVQRRFSSANVYEKGITPTLEAGAGEGGNNMPLVLDTTSVLQKTTTPAISIDEGGGKSSCCHYEEVALTLATTHHGEPAVCYTPNTEPVLLESNQNHATVQTDGVSTALPASMGEGGGYVPMVVQESTTGLTNRGFESGEVAETETMFTLNTVEQHAVAYGIDPQVQSMEVFHCTSEENLAAPLKARDYKDPQCVVSFEPGAATRVGGHVYEDDKSGTLRAKAGDNQPAVCVGLDVFNQASTGDKTMPITSAATDTHHIPCVVNPNENDQLSTIKSQTAVVRRLTCLECERLQGFPDNWTNLGTWVDTQGKTHKDADSPRYKALGNSIALPYWYWMAGNMVDQLKKSGVEHPTMASLFDGIAGFPYVYIRHGCTPLWASEIEEFPIAVCKRHFGDEDTGEVGDIEEYLKLPLNWVTSSSQITSSAHSSIAFDRAAFNQGANAKYDFSIEEDKAQTIVSRGPGGVCQSK